MPLNGKWGPPSVQRSSQGEQKPDKRCQSCHPLLWLFVQWDFVSPQDSDLLKNGAGWGSSVAPWAVIPLKSRWRGGPVQPEQGWGCLFWADKGKLHLGSSHMSWLFALPCNSSFAQAPWRIWPVKFNVLLQCLNKIWHTLDRICLNLSNEKSIIMLSR